MVQVLQDQQAKLVSPVIPALRLDLHVLAGHIEAKLFRCLDVEAKRLIGRRGVETIGPEALIERAGHEDRLAVEKDAVDSLLIFLEGDSALPEIARQLIFGAVVSAKLDFQAVEEWRLGR